MRVNFCFNVRPERGERVEGFGARPLALSTLDCAIADVLRGCVTEDVAGRCRGGDVPHPSADDDAEFRLKIRSMIWVRDLNFSAVSDKGRGGFDPKERFFGERFVLLARVVGVIQADGNNLGWNYRSERAHAAPRNGFAVKRRRSKNITVQSVKLAINDLGVKDFVAFLKSANGCHTAARL